LSFSPRKQITIVVKLGHRKQYNFWQMLQWVQVPVYADLLMK
jgi:hypothetical protein